MNPTSVLAGAAGVLDPNGGIGVFVKVTDTGASPTTPTGTVTITAATSSGGVSVFSGYPIALVKGECYTWVQSPNATDRIPLTFYGNEAAWYITVTYSGDTDHDTSSTEIVVTNPAFGSGE